MKQFLCLIFISLSVSVLHAQEYDNDANLWGHLNLEKKINKKFSVILRLKSRFDNNISRYELGYGRLSVTYSPFKDFKILAGYDYGFKIRNAGYYGNRQTYIIAAMFKKDFRRFRFSYRNRLQVRLNNLNISDDGYIPYVIDRNKFTIRYEATKRLDFYLAEELYVPLMSPSVKGITRTRSFAGLVIKTTKNQSIELYFALQTQIQENNWYKQHKKYSKALNRDFIYGIGYNIEF